MAINDQWKRRIIWMAVLFFITALVVERHQGTGFFNWRSKMWGDAAGYYFYSPALFLYGFDADKLPVDIVEKTGQGFIIDERGKLVTKYTSGVAILQAPVFGLVHLIAGITGAQQDGFSGIYHYVSSIAAILYSFLGLIFLWMFLTHYFSGPVTFFTMSSMFLGTNLLYYTVDATGMSHVYSFFLFASLALLFRQFWQEKPTGKKDRLFLLIALVSGLIVLIRPTNIIFIVLLLLLDTSSLEEIIFRIKEIFVPRRILPALGIVFMVILPQMLYWKYAFGSYISDSYGDQGFIYWDAPQTGKFLFSANNGLFPYNPLYFLLLFAMLYMVYRKEQNGYYLLAFFAGMIYLFSSWFVFSFGCGFGSRNFVEYTVVFALPLGYLYRETAERARRFRVAVISLAVLFVLINLKLTAAFDKCFLEKDWDFKEYAYFLQSRECTRRAFVLKNEVLTPENEYSNNIRINLKRTTLVNYRRARASVDVRLFNPEGRPEVVIAIQSADSVIYWNGYPLYKDYDFSKPGTRQRIRGDFWFPRNHTTDAILSAYVWNAGRDSMVISNLKIHLR